MESHLAVQVNKAQRLNSPCDMMYFCDLVRLSSFSYSRQVLARALRTHVQQPTKCCVLRLFHQKLQYLHLHFQIKVAEL